MSETADPADRHRGVIGRERQVLGCAYHEAGHAVVAIRLGRQVMAISICRGDLSGKTNITKVSIVSECDRRREALIIMAGGIAQERFDPETIRDAAGDKAGTLMSDYLQLNDLLEQSAGCDDESQDHLLAKWKNEAIELVHKSENWTAIVRLVDELSCVYRLELKDIMKITNPDNLLH